MPLGPTSSVAVKMTLTSALCQPAPLAGALNDAVGAFGAVVSTLMPDTVVLAALSARSAAVPVTDWSAPFSRTVCLEQSSMPEPLSAHWKDTVTGLLYQPARFRVLSLVT